MGFRGPLTRVGHERIDEDDVRGRLACGMLFGIVMGIRGNHPMPRDLAVAVTRETAFIAIPIAGPLAMVVA